MHIGRFLFWSALVGAMVFGGVICLLGHVAVKKSRNVVAVNKKSTLGIMVKEEY